MLENKKLKNIAKKNLHGHFVSPLEEQNLSSNLQLKSHSTYSIKQWVYTIMNNDNNIIHMSIKYMTMYGINLLGNGTHPLTKS